MKTVEPETEAQKQRLESITEKIPHAFWGVEAVLGSQ
jgi:hypothetical protein